MDENTTRLLGKDLSSRIHPLIHEENALFAGRQIARGRQDDPGGHVYSNGIWEYLFKAQRNFQDQDLKSVILIFAPSHRPSAHILPLAPTT
jgi:hypothetical protein